MAVNLTLLRDELTDLFTSPPDTVTGCAQAWADAVRGYAELVIPPSTTIDAASTTLASSLSVIFATPQPSTTVPGQLDLAFTVWATTVAAGMAPAYLAVPPPLPVGFSTLTSIETTTEGAVIKFSNAINTWFLTGSATLAVSPFTVVTWT